MDRLEEIQREKAEEEDFNDRLRHEIIRMKINQKKDQEEQKQVDRMIWNLERDRKMEDIVRK